MKNLIDDTDSKIITLLEQNGRIPNTELAKKLKISETTVRKRIKRLIDDDLIKVVAVKNRAKLGYGTNGNIRIEADTRKTKKLADKLGKMKELWYVAQLAGDAEFDIEYSVSTRHDLLLLLDKINKFDGVIRTRTSIRLKLIKQLGEFIAFTNPSASKNVKV
ncbi:MAG: Lrp/AsnC family transcriptional regulator [Desulfobacterales bacterium]|nr:Lrp/AsnC family transcriptional regulator [Desulfobacterales bacterium]